MYRQHETRFRVYVIIYKIYIFLFCLPTRPPRLHSYKAYVCAPGYTCGMCVHVCMHVCVHVCTIAHVRVAAAMQQKSLGAYLQAVLLLIYYLFTYHDH